MKRISLLALFVFSASVSLFAQNTRTIGNGSQPYFITENITLHDDTIYKIDGYVYVKNNSTITIEPGTIIKGVKANRSTLIITRGSKLIAEGTKTRPIIFTSEEDKGVDGLGDPFRNAGDWGGIVLLGKAPINKADCSTCPGSAIAASEPGNQNNIEGDLDNANGDGLYGGTDAADNSGILKYVRIEFSGVVITTGNEINGLTLGGVGSGTELDYIQVSDGFDDSYEWFGGTAQAKHLISVACGDDDFDTDFGFSGKIQFGIAQRDSNAFDRGAGPTTNGFESDNDGNGSEANPINQCVFSNMTIVGPWDGQNGLIPANSFNNGARIRRASAESIMNSVIMGYPTGIFLDGSSTHTKYIGDTALYKNDVLAGNKMNLSSNTDINAVVAKFMTQGNDTNASSAGLITRAFDYKNPDFSPATSSILLAGASFTGAKISDPFFTPTTYRGAIGDVNWTECWSNFDPQNEDYSVAPYDLSPVADFDAGTSGNGATYNFTNNSAKSTTYAWDFGVTGSNTDTSTAANPSFTFPANGTYTVTLTSTSVCGTATKTADVNVNISAVNKVNPNIASYMVYPNPTNGNATFSFNTLKSESGVVELLDAMGRQVAILSSGYLAAGAHDIHVDGAMLNNGVYFVKVNTESSTLSVKFIVVK